MRSKLGTLCMIFGAALIVAALSLLYINQREASRAEAAVNTLMPQVVEQISIRRSERPAGEVPDLYDPTMTEVEIDGYGYVGYLAIPALGLELPVMGDWDYTRLKIAPCRYSGSTKSGDIVIAAHNYARHFGGLSGLPLGELVTFTDMDGITTEYQVTALEVLEPTAVEEMTAGEFGLTLFTCTYGGRSRVTVRCEKLEE